MNKKKLVIGLLSIFVLVGAFQNCAPDVKFIVTDVKLTSLVSPDGTVEDVICDPFSPGSTCAAGEGLKGSIYYLRSDDTTSPRANVDDIIKYGLKAPWPLVFSHFNVAQRTWTDGFPSDDGLMKNANGEPLIEWFAFHLEGSIAIKSGQETEYQFATFSDDGSILWIDGAEVVSHDGHHSPTWKCAPQKVSLTPGRSHAMRLKYFQGPRDAIALRVLWRPWSESNKPCGDGFTPVPSSVLFHAVR